MLTDERIFNNTSISATSKALVLAALSMWKIKLRQCRRMMALCQTANPSGIASGGGVGAVRLPFRRVTRCVLACRLFVLPDNRETRRRHCAPWPAAALQK
jgi:hypothetical protein